ncbi:hypothetical protein GA0061098_1005289 [Bradyrhizobium shewense]|uniref:Uncharacterized protein n=1 Tax=Bradyrhizobium shewense TaxID=1761772 RepID=A0A1C3VUV1_9BRAD|nr:hypothetical protein GA0061098_1005289 [Bradyrhizobium shewense]
MNSLFRWSICLRARAVHPARFLWTAKKTITAGVRHILLPVSFHHQGHLAIPTGQCTLTRRPVQTMQMAPWPSPASEKTGNQQAVPIDLHLRCTINACQVGLYLLRISTPTTCRSVRFKLLNRSSEADCAQRMSIARLSMDCSFGSTLRLADICLGLLRSQSWHVRSLIGWRVPTIAVRLALLP